MKQLISAKEMQDFVNEGGKVFYVEKDMLLTPSAKDIAKNSGIQVEFGTKPAVCATVSSSATVQTSCTTTSVADTIEGFDKDMLTKLFKAMMDKGFLTEMLATLSNQSNLPYTCDADPTGLKVVRGNTVKMDVFETGNPNATAYYQELVSKDESQMSAGFLVIENSKFEWELTYEEIDYVIEGTLTIEINGKTYTAHAGDVLFVPKNSKVVWGSPDKARVFYATYPANWADLI
jgi:ethanolamine utilization protein EutQ